MDELLKERLELIKDRVAELEKEEIKEESYSAYFKGCAAKIAELLQVSGKLADGSFDNMSLEELQALNRKQFEEVQGEHYETSYANPAYAVEKFGKEFGQLLSALYVEIRNSISSVYANRDEEFAATAELFLEVYGAFVCAWEDGVTLPSYEEVKQIFYWYYSDYAERKQLEAPEETVPVEKEKKADTRQRSQKLKFSYQEAKDYETIEADIEALETKIAQCDVDMAANSTDFVKLNEIGKIKEALENQLMEKMERWEYLMEKAEQIAQQK